MTLQNKDGWAFSISGGIILMSTIRGNDDRYNYMFGGAAGAFPWLKKWYGGTGMATVMAVPLGIILYFVKYTWDYDVIVKPRGNHVYCREVNVVTGGSLGEGDFTFGWGVPDRPRVPQKN